MTCPTSSTGDSDALAADLGHPSLPSQPRDAGRGRCSTATPVIHLTQGKSTTLDLQILDRNGESISGILEGQSAATFPGRLIIKQTDQQTTAHLTVDGTATDTGSGLVLQVEIDGEVVDIAGLLVGEAQILGDDDAVLATTRYWVEIAPSLSAANSGALTIAEIRMQLRDCPEFNELLDSYEFSDSEIIAALRMCIDEFNATNQPFTSYTTSTFPYPFRYFWARGAASKLLRMGAVGYERSRLNYSAGGVTVNEKDKSDSYINMSRQLEEEWKTWVAATKRAINISNGFGSLVSPYSLQW